jgi:hypothetical protein
MDSAEIQKILDDLDIQLTVGKIDLPTYQVLAKKWSTRLAIGEASLATATYAPVSNSLTAVKVACPNCGAPMGEDLSPDRRFYTCEYCSHKFAFEQARDQTEQLRQELQGWLSKLVSGAAAGGNAVDATSRAFIFRERLYPSLEMEFNRSMELLEGFREYPLYQTELGALFRGYSSEESPLRAEHQQLAPVRNLTGKLCAPAVREFVVSAEDEQRLAAMQSSTMELIYTANIMQQSARYCAEGYVAARQNLDALRDLYHTTQKRAASASEKQFLSASLARLESAGTVMDVLSRVYSSASGELMGSAFSGELDTAKNLYAQALQLVDESGYSPMQTVPWRHGVEKEVALVELQTGLLNAYDRVVANAGGSFFEFQSALVEFTRQSKAPVADPQSLAAVADGLALLVEARRGGRTLPRLADWSWLGDFQENNRSKKVMFLGKEEQIESLEQYWQPFWLASLSFSQSEGALFKSGSAKQALLILDATSPQQCFASTVEDGSVLNVSLQGASKRQVPDQRLTLPSLVTEASAQIILESYARSNPVLRNPKVTLQQVVYLPAARVVYKSKEGTRVLVGSVISSINPHTDQLRYSTGVFVKRYARA